MVFEEINAVEAPDWVNLAEGVAAGLGSGLLIVGAVAVCSPVAPACCGADDAALPPAA